MYYFIAWLFYPPPHCLRYAENEGNKNDVHSQDLPEGIYETVILFRGHETEADESVVQEGEGGAVPYHQSLADAVIKEHVRVCLFPGDFHEHEIGCRLVTLNVIPCV